MTRLRRMFKTAVLAICTASIVPGSTLARRSSAGLLHIREVTGHVVQLGTWGTGGNRSPMYGVRLRVDLCVNSPKSTYPEEIRITHYVVTKSPSRWWPAHTSIDRAPWLVPLGETWKGKSCGPVLLEDAVPPGHYGVESLGNPRACYGVGVTIKARGQSASGRAIVTCGKRFGH